MAAGPGLVRPACLGGPVPRRADAPEQPRRHERPGTSQL